MRNLDEVNAELKKKFNPEGSNLRNAQYRMVEMLKWVDKIMRKHKIPYSLTAGTLLGAVRHEGFIPWDDDIDLMVPQDYYEKMKCAFLSEEHPQYVLQCSETDPYAFKCWCTIRDKNSKYLHSDPYYNTCEAIMKYTGLQIDLFPIDNHTEIHINRIISHCSWGGVCYYYTRCKWLAFWIYRLQHMACRLLQKITPAQPYWSYGYGITGTRYTYRKNMIFPFSTIEFENYVFPAPHDIDAFLKSHFGDYMKMPDMSMLNKHSIETYDIW